MLDGGADALEVVARVLGDDRVEEAAGEALAAAAAGDHEVGDLVVGEGLEADEVGEGEAVEPAPRGVVIVGLGEVDVGGDGGVAEVVVAAGEEEEGVLALADEDGGEELALAAADAAGEQEAVAGGAPEVGDALGGDDLALDAVDDGGREVAAAVVAGVVERAGEHRGDRAGDRRDGAGDDAELEAVLEGDVVDGGGAQRGLVADVRAAEELGGDDAGAPRRLALAVVGLGGHRSGR